jgi:hypothetical protein
VAALCATVAAAAGIAGSSAKTSSKKSRTTNNSTQSGTPAHPRLRRVMFGGPVHAEVVVLNKAGTAWITVTEDNGTFSSLSGDQLTITEGTKAVPYKTVTLTIPADAKIIRNGKTAKLTDFVANDHIHVMQSSEGTIVIGGDEKPVFDGPFGKGGGPKGPMHIHPGGGPGFPGPGMGPLGPPPAAGGSSSNGSDSGSSSSTDGNS